MKKIWIILLLLLLWAVPVKAEEPAEWTVMFYLCGSDLESKHGFASGNLGEIMGCYPYAVLRNAASFDEEVLDTSSVDVNVVIQTGGSREWHAQDLGMEIDPGALQRWHYHPTENLSLYEENTFDLEAELPLASMADPETLTDFIRWSAEKYPAKKYALVLWDHGGGSKTGIFIDELFDGDTLYLDELHDALAAGGVDFEAVLFDACLMANLETAYAIQDHARWMIASEEVVAGKGTAIGDWLQQLYYASQWDGKRLGRWICDMTLVKYANEADEQTQDTLTWSVIDLSKTRRVAKAFDRFMELAGLGFSNEPFQMMANASIMNSAFEFGLGDDSMRDLAGIFYNSALPFVLEKDLYQDMMDGLTEAVVYNVRGNGRSSAGGLSFCYAADFSAAELDIYARNCPSPHYLAFLDAIHPEWTAPDWVYEQAERLPSIQEIPEYEMKMDKVFTEGGMPAIGKMWDTSFNLRYVYADLYWLNPKTGRVVQLGTTVTSPYVDGDFNMVFAFDGFGVWPAIEGVHCNAMFVSEGLIYSQMYNIPVQIGTDNFLLRCGFDASNEEPLTVYGLWEGYDSDSSVFNRNVVQLSQIAGQEFRLLYPIDGTGENGKTRYETSDPLTMYRSLQITAEPLDPGTYYLDYWVEDLFMRRLDMERVEVYWDGENVTTVTVDWSGTTTLQLLQE